MRTDKTVLSYALGVTLLLGLLAGCATPNPRTRYLEELQPGSLTNLTAYRSGANIEIRFPFPGKAGFAHASWGETGTSATNYLHQFAVLSFDKEDHVPRKNILAKTNQLAIRPAEEWRRLVHRIFTGLAPSLPQHGVLFLIQNQEAVVFRDKSDKVVVVTLQNKPPDIVMDRTYDDADFSRAALALLEQGMATLDPDQRQFLFLTGGDPAFVFIDLRQRLIVFLSYPGDPESQELPGAFAVRALNSLLIRSLVITAIKNPFTLVARAFWHLGASGAAAVMPGPDNPIPPPPLASGPGMDLSAWERELDGLVSERRYKGKIDFYIDGEQFFPAFIQSVQAAKRSVDLQVFIFDTDDYAVKVADVLKEQSKSVKVHVLMDDMGSLFSGATPAPSASAPGFQPPADIANYLTSGSRVRARASANPWLTLDHRKCFIIDDCQAFVGGMNIGREYRYDWHDMMAGITGPIVGRLEKDFEKAWAHAGPFGDFAYAWVSLFEPAASRRNSITNGIDVRPLRTATGRVEIYNAQLAAINRAKSYIYIENAYFDDDIILRALIRARQRGVDVRVVFPAENDAGIMQISDQIVGNELIANGARVFVYPGMTHVKAAIYDGWACIGSANLTKMSLRVGQELDISFSDPPTVDRLKLDLFEKDFSKSRELKTPVPLDWTDSFVKYFADQL